MINIDKIFSIEINSNNYEKLKDLKGYKILEKIFIVNLNNKTIILKNLENLLHIDILNSKIDLILDEKLNKFNILYQTDSLDTRIYDKYNYLGKINTYNLIVSNKQFNFDDRFNKVSLLKITNCKVNFNCNNYSSLDILDICNSVIDANSNFKNLRRFLITDLRDNSLNLNNSSFPSLVYLFFESDNINSLIFNSYLSNLNSLYIFSNSLKRVIMYFNNDNEELGNFIIHTTNKIKFSSDFRKVLNFHKIKNYDIDFPVKKSSNTIY